MAVRVQTECFDAGAEMDALRRASPRVGAVAAFVGVARDFNDGARVSSLTLEHYPGMTESALGEIVAQAHARWSLIDLLIVHRVGLLHPADPIVLVAVSSSHRRDAFAACEFVMDYLKTRAPFWKKEVTAEGARWVEARQSDEEALERWNNGG